jgi:hypothetical protein
LESALVPRWIWNWCWDNCARDQCRLAEWLHFWLSLIAPFGRRVFGSIFQITDMLSCLHLRNLLQSAPHALGLAESVLGGLYRSVCAALCGGRLDRLAANIAEVEKVIVKNVTKLELSFVTL